MYPFLPEGLYPVTGSAPETTNGGKTTDYISVKNAEMVWVVIHLTQAVGHATAFTLEKATAVAPTGSTAITNTVPIWYGNMTTANSKLVRQTDAVSFTVDVGVTGTVIIVFQVDPASLGTTFDCLCAKAANSAQATNFWEVMFWIKPRYQSKPSSQTATEYLVD